MTPTNDSSSESSPTSPLQRALRSFLAPGVPPPMACVPSGTSLMLEWGFDGIAVLIEVSLSTSVVEGFRSDPAAGAPCDGDSPSSPSARGVVGVERLVTSFAASEGVAAARGFLARAMAAANHDPLKCRRNAWLPGQADETCCCGGPGRARRAAGLTTSTLPPSFVAAEASC